MTAKFTNTAEYWAAEITATERRIETLHKRYNANHMHPDYDWKRASDEITKASEELDILYRKLDECHKRDAGIMV